MNKRNLEILADYLIGNVLPARFNMSKFSFECTPTGSRGVNELTHCGTVGCAAGHGPYAHPDLAKLTTEDWLEYTHRVFGMHKTSDEWTWCFGGEWANYDNTPKGAAQRIKYLLADNDLPDHFRSIIEDEVGDREDDDFQESFEMCQFVTHYQKAIPL